MPPMTTRREFFCSLGVAGCATLMLPSCVTIINQTAAPGAGDAAAGDATGPDVAPGDAKGQETVAGSDSVKGIDVSDAQADVLAFDLAVSPYQVLTQPGGMIGVDIDGKPVLLIRVDDQQLVALGRICSHASCDMDPDQFGQWHQDSKELECLCHQSHYKPDGTVASGPAKAPLAKYMVKFDPATGTGTVQV